MKKISIFLLMIAGMAFSQAFTEITTGLPNVRSGCLAWGDYDNDGDLDIVISGNHGGSNEAGIYRNDSGSFTNINAGLPNIGYSSADWGDYDNDGDIDLIITGVQTALDGSGYFSSIYKNNSGTFTLLSAGLTGVSSSISDWGDYDNDGDLDLFLSGVNSSGSYISKIYRNNTGVFSDINAEITGVWGSSGGWIDYDNDGDLDILITGATGIMSNPNAVSKIYKNDNGIFTDINAGFPGILLGSTEWGDYDNDGFSDLLYCGYTGTVSITKLYHNNGNGTFTEINSGLINIGYYASRCTAKWGDSDNDGDLDILLAGMTAGSQRVSIVYRNNGDGTFTDSNAGITGLDQCLSAWGDYDNDGDLDVVILGYGTTYTTKLYRNNSGIANTVPSAPHNLTSAVTGSDVTLSWNKAADAETPQNGLSYNLYLRILNSSALYKGSESDNSSGYRKIACLGNTNQVNTITLKNLTGGCRYLWSVQAIDHAFAGSDFADENSFTVGTLPDSLPEPIAVSASNILSRSFKAGWNTVPGANGYYLDIAKDVNFAEFLPGYNNKNVGSVASIDISGLDYNTDYFYRVRAYNSAWTSSNSNEINVRTQILLPPTVINTTIKSYGFYPSWTSSDAHGYCIDVATDSIFTDYLSGYQSRDVGNVTTCSVTGLTSNTKYFYRLRGYDSIGNQSVNSDMITVTTAILLAPVATNASNITYSGFRINWNTSSFASGYVLDLATDSIFVNYVTGYQDKDVRNTTYYNVPSMISSSKYYYRLRSYDSSANRSVYSNVISVTTLAIPAPDATSASIISSTDFKANWNSISGASGYRLDVATDSTFINFVAGYENKDAGNVTNLSVTGLGISSTYFYRVRSYDSGKTSGNSNIIEVKTLSMDVSLSFNSGNIVLDWSEITGALSYKVYACETPYGTFTDVSGQGIFDGSSWSKAAGTEKKYFYYIVVVSE